MAGQEPLLRFAEPQGRGELGLLDAVPIATIDDEAVLLDDVLDREPQARLVLDFVAHPKEHALDGRALCGILPCRVARGKTEEDPSILDALDLAETELRLCLAEKPLPDDKGRHCRVF